MPEFRLGRILRDRVLWTSVAVTGVLLTASGAAARREPPPREWIRTSTRWGIKGALQFGIHPGADPARPDGPRGLIRFFSPVLPDGGYDLINFIAVEPIVRGVKCYSELEPSQTDGKPGKLFSLEETEPVTLRALSPGVEELTVRLRVERFINGAHVRLALKQRSDRPDELELLVYPEEGSAPMEYCILTATMGNKARTRLLWLKEGPVSSLKLYPDYRGSAFTPHTTFPLEKLLRTAAGDALAAVTTDEADPRIAVPFPGSDAWRYPGEKVTQYWRKPGESVRPDLHVAVNARYTYWMSEQPIPGGIAFENFEMRERFYPGQRFVFGITRRTPDQLGFSRR